MLYNWQQDDWPTFRYDLSGIEDALLAFAEKTGRASGLLTGLSAEAQTEAAIEMMVIAPLRRGQTDPIFAPSDSYLTEFPPPFPATLTTTTLDRRRLPRFEVCACTPTSRGLPSS